MIVVLLDRRLPQDADNNINQWATNNDFAITSDGEILHIPEDLPCKPLKKCSRKRILSTVKAMLQIK
jgi:hypothetical protein